MLIFGIGFEPIHSNLGKVVNPDASFTTQRLRVSLPMLMDWPSYWPQRPEDEEKTRYVLLINNRAWGLLAFSGGRVAKIGRISLDSWKVHDIRLRVWSLINAWSCLSRQMAFLPPFFSHGQGIVLFATHPPAHSFVSHQIVGHLMLLNGLSLCLTRIMWCMRGELRMHATHTHTHTFTGTNASCLVCLLHSSVGYCITNHLWGRYCKHFSQQVEISLQLTGYGLERYFANEFGGTG